MDFKPLFAVFLLTVSPAIAEDTAPQNSRGGSPQSALSLEQQVEEVVQYLTGVMDTSAQAATNSRLSDVRMTTCRVTLQGASLQHNAVYLYQEQALSSDLTKPYRQRFLQISPSTYSQTVRSLSFRPLSPKSLIGLCNQPEVDRVVQASALGQPVCQVFLKRSGESYAGRTPIDGCPANVRGATRITNQITLHKTGMSTWDRGYNEAGKQVWGAKTESYQYRKR